MKTKSIIALLLSFIITCSLVACSKDDERFVAYDYDLSKYITLGEYKGISYKTTVPEEVTEELINAEISSALEENELTSEVDITDRPAQLGDTVNIDYEGIKDGVAFEGGTAQGSDLILGSNTFIDGFEDGLVGVNVGEEVALNLTFPEAYKNTDLAGQDVVFNVKVNSITETVYPELTDEIVAQISDYSNVADYKAYINSYLTSDAKQQAENNDINTIWTTVVSNANIIEYPEKEYKHYHDEMYNYAVEIAEKYNMSVDDYLSLSGYTADTFEKECVDYAQTYITHYMTAVAIYKQENLEMTDEEFDKYSTEVYSAYGCTNNEEMLEIVKEQFVIDSQIIHRYVVDYVVENAVAQ